MFSHLFDFNLFMDRQMEEEQRRIMLRAVLTPQAQERCKSRTKKGPSETASTSLRAFLLFVFLTPTGDVKVFGHKKNHFMGSFSRCSVFRQTALCLDRVGRFLWLVPELGGCLCMVEM